MKNNSKNTPSNLLALGVKLNQKLEQRLLSETENLEEDLKRFWEKVPKLHEHQCWEWKASTFSGYGEFKILRRRLKAHRVSYILHYERLIPEGMFVCHSCDNKKCVNPNHLWLGTNKDNQLDNVKKGRVGSRKGEMCFTSKLTDSQVLEIRRLCSKGIKQYKIAKMFNIHPPQVSRIKNRYRWDHI